MSAMRAYCPYEVQPLGTRVDGIEFSASTAFGRLRCLRAGSDQGGRGTEVRARLDLTEVGDAVMDEVHGAADRLVPPPMPGDYSPTSRVRRSACYPTRRIWSTWSNPTPRSRRSVLPNMTCSTGTGSGRRTLEALWR